MVITLQFCNADTISHHNTRQTATNAVPLTHIPRTAAHIDHAARERASLSRSRLDTFRVSEEHGSRALEEPLWPDASHLTNIVGNFGSSAPATLHGRGTHPVPHELRPSTAPVHEQRDFDKDLPPERSLPFETSRSTNPKPMPAKSRKVSRDSDKVTQRAAADLSEHDYETTGGKSGKSTDHIVAKDIDTQLLFAKVEAKKLMSKNRGMSKTKTKHNPAIGSQARAPANKSMRNISCLSCRSKRRKCERNPDNPDGMCVPCASKGQKCSFVTDTDLALPGKDDSAQAVVTHVPDSQEDKGQVSQSLRLSLRVRGVPPINDDAALLQPAESHVVTKSQSGRKRSSQLAVPVPKRVRRAKQDSNNRESIPTTNSKTSSAKMIGQPGMTHHTKSVSAHRTTSEPIENIRSDATTMTAASLDLDPLPLSAANIDSKAIAKHQATPPGAKTNSHQRQRPRSPSVRSARPTETLAPDVCERDKVEAQDMFRTLMTSDLSTFLTMNSDQQNNIVDSFFTVALFSDDFLKLANIVETRWKTEMFDSKV